MIINSKTLFMSIILMTLCNTSSAAKIYKWVDEQGKVHFSSDASQAKTKGKIEDVKVRGTKKNKSYRSNRLSGKWYSDYRNIKHELVFRRNGVNLKAIADGGYGSIYFGGKLKRENSDLHITYLNTQYDSVELGKTEIYKIITKSDNELLLQFPDKSLRKFFKFGNRRYGKSNNRLLKGKWNKINSDELIEFAGSRFDIKKIDHARTYKNDLFYYVLSQGQWKKSNKNLSFTYIGKNNHTEKMGSTKTYKIIYLDDRKLTMQDEKTGNLVKYEKVIID